MCSFKEREQAFENLINICNILETNRSDRINYKMTRGIIWPPIKIKLGKTLKRITKIIKFIEFNKLQYTSHYVVKYKEEHLY